MISKARASGNCKHLEPQNTWRGLWPQPNSKFQIPITNIEQGISNYEVGSRNTVILHKPGMSAN